MLGVGCLVLVSAPGLSSSSSPVVRRASSLFWYMDAGRYYSTYPGQWSQLDKLSRGTSVPGHLLSLGAAFTSNSHDLVTEILFLDLSTASWLNFTMSGAQGRFNSRCDTIVAFPNFSKTHRTYSCQNYQPMSKYQYPKEVSLEERRLSTHYELQKSVPGEESSDEVCGWQRPFERGILVQVGQKGQNPIDTDFIVRLSPKSRIKMCTNLPDAYSSGRVNDVRLSRVLRSNSTSWPDCDLCMLLGIVSISIGF